MSTPNLAIPHILQSQAQKEVTANQALDALDEALNDRVTIDVSAGDTTVAAEDFHRNVLLVLTGTPAAALDLIVPASKRLFVVQNGCGRDVAVTTGAGAVVVLTDGQRRLLYGDGTDVVAIAPDFASVGADSGGGGGGLPAFKGALLQRTTHTAIASGVQTTLAWEGTVYDTDGFVDLVGQPTRITVPAGKGITRVQLLCGIQWGPNSSGDRWVEIHKNGAQVPGLPAYLGPTEANNRSRIALASAPITVADGDHFQCLVWHNAGGSLDLEADPQTWFALQVVETATAVEAGIAPNQVRPNWATIRS